MSPKNIAIFTVPMILLFYFSVIQNDNVVLAIPNILTNDTVAPSGLTNESGAEANEYAFVREWGSYGAGDGEVDGIYGVAVDSSDNVYVTDINNHRIQKFDSNGNFITKWGTEGSGDDFAVPQGIE